MEQQSPENHGNDRKGNGEAYESGFRGRNSLIQGLWEYYWFETNFKKSTTLNYSLN